MSVSLLPIDQLPVPKAFQNHASYFNPKKEISRHKFPTVRCCDRGREGSTTARTKKNYYELLGVSVDSNTQEIKEAYRKLQKKYHPDIAGQKGHEYTIMLNEAYNVLTIEDLKTKYYASIGHMTMQFGKNDHVVTGSSSWKGPLRPQALFVDENACVGCRECVHHASNTFMMDESIGCARVKVQYGDDPHKTEVSVESCPVNCIYWVDREELALLEFLIRPKPKQGYGVFGQGWERPANVFMAAKSFSKQLRQQAEHHHSKVRTTVEEETPAQAEARAKASLKIKMERFSKIWDSVKELFG